MRIKTLEHTHEIIKKLKLKANICIDLSLKDLGADIQINIKNCNLAAYVILFYFILFSFKLQLSQSFMFEINKSTNNISNSTKFLHQALFYCNICLSLPLHCSIIMFDFIIVFSQM